MDVIRLEKMQFYGYHGVSESERELGGKFEVDLEMFFPLQKAGKSDRLEDTLDYEAAYNLVQSCVVQKKYFLLETLAESIIEAISFCLLTVFKDPVVCIKPMVLLALKLLKLVAKVIRG